MQCGIQEQLVNHKKIVLKGIIGTKLEYELWIRQKYEIRITFPEFESCMKLL